MEQSIRTNVYAIVVVSFCIGLLYGMRAHAEEPQAMGMARVRHADACDKFIDHVHNVSSNATITAIGKIKAEKVRARAIKDNAINKNEGIALTQANVERKDEVSKLNEVKDNLATLYTDVSNHCDGNDATAAQSTIKEAGDRVENVILVLEHAGS